MKQISYAVSGILIAGIIVWVTYIQAHQAKTAYVQLGKVYSDFQMTKELDVNYKNTEGKRKHLLDSIELQLRMLSAGLADKKDEKKIMVFQEQRQMYAVKKQEYAEDNQRMAQQYQEQITKQLNQYISDYGKEKGYDYVFGAEGSGALMYAKESSDISKEVIDYINERYKGKK